MTNKRKIFILDTSVLLYDKGSIHAFPKSEVVLPLVVLDELDRFKDRDGILGENARYINRFLDELRDIGSLHTGVLIEELDQVIRVEINHSGKVPTGLDPKMGDNKIISVALEISSKNDNIVVVTKDINFRVKCDALGIKSEDYIKDRIVLDKSDVFAGYKDIFLNSSDIVDDFYEDGKLEISQHQEFSSLHENEFACLKFESHSGMGMRSGDNIVSIKKGDSLKMTHTGISPRNREQLFALNLLMRESIPLVTLTGLAGSGKTFLALMAGLELMNQGKFDRIVITRNIQPVGRDIGFLPGNIDDKMSPWIAPIVDNFRQGLKDSDLTYFQIMKERGQIEIAPLAFMRGRTFSNTFLILDEAQNATIHELKTVITRIGENSKIVLLGDIDQIDTPYIDSLSNGLTVIIEKMKKEKLSGHITLKKGERSDLATLASRII